MIRWLASVRAFAVVVFEGAEARVSFNCSSIIEPRVFTTGLHLGLRLAYPGPSSP